MTMAAGVDGPRTGGHPGFILYSRSWCHLCEDMLAALQAMAPPGARFDVDVIDVDADPALVARFDELVPVLFARNPAGGEGQQLCHYFLDRDAVERCLGAAAAA